MFILALGEIEGGARSGKLVGVIVDIGSGEGVCDCWVVVARIITTERIIKRMKIIASDFMFEIESILSYGWFFLNGICIV